MDFEIKVKRLRQEAIMPQTMTEGSAGMDLAIPYTKAILPGIHYIQLGFAIEIPEKHVGLIAPRSSLHKSRLSLANTVGVIDSDYRGELTLALEYDGPGTILEVGQRLAQLLIMPIRNCAIIEEQELTNTERGDGGFGSTDRK